MIRQVLEDAASRAILSAPLRTIHGFVNSGRPVVIDNKRLDDATRYLLSVLALAGPSPIEQLSPTEARAIFAKSGGAIAPPARRMAKVVDLRLDVTPVRLSARLYVPRNAPRAMPALVYMHGGGWVIGGIDTHDRLCRVLADDAGCAVISVDYRLAPEHKFPAAVDDAKSAFAWVARNAVSLGIDPKRIAVGGDSAGGNLSAVVSLAGATGLGPQPVYQLLSYPVTDFACDTTSYDLFGDGFYLTRNLMHWFRMHYLPTMNAIGDPAASPLRADIPPGVAPAFVMTAGYDPLLDEGAAYAAKLRGAGCDVIYRCHEGLIHGFASMTGVVPVAREAVHEAAMALRLAFARL
jgi:acetyl esterase